MKTMKDVLYSDNLLLVNRKAPLCKKYCPNSLIAPDCAASTGVLLTYSTTKMLNLCIIASGCTGSIIADSGYRSNSEQRDLYNTSLAENGVTFTTSYVAFPRCSEHETGLAVDLRDATAPFDPIRPCLPRDGIFAHFRSIAAQYGFIERYKKEKTSYTGIAAEPWHFRYVGWPHSIVMEKYALCFEEYHEFLDETALDNPMVYTQDGRSIHLFKTCLESIREVVGFFDSKYHLWNASHDNTGKVVITAWI